MNINNIEFIIPAAGQSSRNYPHTKGLPHKIFLPFGDIKIIDLILQQIINTGGVSVTFVLSDKYVIKYLDRAFSKEREIETGLQNKGFLYQAEQTKKLAFGDKIQINYVIQKNPLGEAHALGLAYKKAKGKYIAHIRPDDIILPCSNNKEDLLKKAISYYLEHEKNIATVFSVSDASRFSIIIDGKPVEKPNSIILNRIKNPKAVIYATFFSPEIGYYMMEKSKKITTGDFRWVDAINACSDQKMEEFIIDKKSYSYLDCGTMQNYEISLLYSLLKLSYFSKANIEFVEKILEGTK